MSDFHRGDVVYIRSVGTVSEVEQILVNTGLDGSVKILGYVISQFGLRSSDDLELVMGGEPRRITEEYLANRRLG